jgi:hypothetical protein
LATVPTAVETEEVEDDVFDVVVTVVEILVLEVVVTGLVELVNRVVLAVLVGRAVVVPLEAPLCWKQVLACRLSMSLSA